MDLHDHVYPYMEVHPANEKRNYLMDIMTQLARLGEQEKMALACIYEY